MIKIIILCLGAYLLGSLSSAILVCKIMGLPDPRTQGSQNPGATNVLRISGAKLPAALVLIGDTLKGLVPIIIGTLLGIAPAELAGVGLAAFLGHLYPIFFGFRGGKGVATALGVQFGIAWPVGLSVALIWLFVAKALKISSLAGLLSMGLAPILFWLFQKNLELIIMQLIITGLLIWRHRQNIRNLINGTEGRITNQH